MARERGGRLGPRDPAVTSRMMAAVRNKDSKAELRLRRALHAAGLRYRLHSTDLPGRPDLVIRSRRLAVFVDGDMWHGNPEEVRRRGRENLAELFPSRTEWWVAKIQRNMARDQEVTKALRREGWTVIRLWEHDVLADTDAAARKVLQAVGRALPTVESPARLPRRQPARCKSAPCGWRRQDEPTNAVAITIL